MLAAAEYTSASARTMKGRLRTPGFFSTVHSSCTVALVMSSGAKSILLTTKNAGTRSASTIPKCSLHMPTSPALAPTSTIAYSGRWPVRPKQAAGRSQSPMGSARVSTRAVTTQLL